MKDNKRKRTRLLKRTVGDVVQVPLEDGTHTYARVLRSASYAFYDSRVTEEVPIDQIAQRPILFIVAVMDYAVREGRWPIVGHIASDDGLVPPPTFIQDPLDSNSFSIYEHGQIRKATRKECTRLERTAVWEPEQVEDRLRDHYAGRKNRVFESLRLV